MAPCKGSPGAAGGVHHQVWCQLQDLYGEHYLRQEDTTCRHYCCCMLRLPIVAAARRSSDVCVAAVFGLGFRQLHHPVMLVLHWYMHAQL